MLNAKRCTEWIQRNYRMTIINTDERAHTIKMNKSTNIFDDIHPSPTSRGIVFKLTRINFTINSYVIGLTVYFS